MQEYRRYVSLLKRIFSVDIENLLPGIMGLVKRNGFKRRQENSYNECNIQLQSKEIKKSQKTKKVVDTWHSG